MVAQRERPKSQDIGMRRDRRNPEMRQTKKGGQYYFGMKVHAAVGAGTG